MLLSDFNQLGGSRGAVQAPGCPQSTVCRRSTSSSSWAALTAGSDLGRESTLVCEALTAGPHLSSSRRQHVSRQQDRLGGRDSHGLHLVGGHQGRAEGRLPGRVR